MFPVLFLSKGTDVSVSSLLEYQGIVQKKAPISFLTTLSDIAVQAVSEILLNLVHSRSHPSHILHFALHT
jgi:hypothetical protein